MSETRWVADGKGPRAIEITRETEKCYWEMSRWNGLVGTPHEVKRLRASNPRLYDTAAECLAAMLAKARQNVANSEMALEYHRDSLARLEKLKL